MFEVKNMRSGYGEVNVLHGLDFKVGHEMYAILGANGAGKSTLMKTIAKVLPLKTGQIFFKDEDVSGITSYQLAEKGLLNGHIDWGILYECTCDAMAHCGDGK